MTDPDADRAPAAPHGPRAVADPTDDFEVMTGLELQGERRIPRKQVWSWALWDWATQPFNSVITTFVFSVYLTSALFLAPEVAGLGEGDPAYDRGLADLSSRLGSRSASAGLLIALLAPVLGQRADAEGRRKALARRSRPAALICAWRDVLRRGRRRVLRLGISLSPPARCSARSRASTTTRCWCRCRRRTPSAGSADSAGASATSAASSRSCSSSSRRLSTGSACRPTRARLSA